MTRDTIEMACEAGAIHIHKQPKKFALVGNDTIKAFEALVRADEQANAFRAGVLYAAKKYAAVSEDTFTGNDVSMFLEMEEAELSDEDIAAIAKATGEQA